CGYVKTFESVETSKERNEFSRAKGVSESRRRGKRTATVQRKERCLATMVANLRSARVERCQAKMDAMSRIEFWK
ncbi:hypothetical protein C7R21_11260, partial [Staphylococcus aureus]